MNQRLSKLILGLALFTGFFAAHQVSAQVIPSNLWNPNYASGTITPRPSTLQVPCANIVGGCASGATSSTINGVAGPTFTFSIVSTSSASSITTSSQQVFLNILQNTSSSDITISSTGTIVFANHNISQFTNNVPYLTSSTGVTSLNSQTGAATYSVNAGTGLSVTTSTTSSTITLNINGGSIQNCAAGQTVNSLSATGTIACVVAVQTIAGVSTSTITISGTSNEIAVATTTNSITLSTPQAIGTGSSPTFSGITITNNVTSSAVTATSSTLPSYIANNNNSFTFPTPTMLAAGTTCGNTANVTDAGACVNDIYSYGSTLASSTDINVGPYTYTYSTPIVFGTQSELVHFHGVSGFATIFSSTQTTGNLVTLNDCNSNKKRYATQIEDLAISGVTATTTSGGTVGIFAGGANGACASQISDVMISAVTYGIEVGNNTYFFATRDVAVSNVYRAYYVLSSVNSGESLENFNFKPVDPAGTNIGGIASSTNYIYIADGATPKVDFYGGSADNSCNYLGTNDEVNFYGFYQENPAYATYGTCDFFISSSTSVVNWYGGTIQEDATSTSAGGSIPEYFSYGGNVNFWGTSFIRNTGTSATSTGHMANYITGSGGILALHDVSAQSTPFNGGAIIVGSQLTAAQLSAGDFTSVSGGYFNGTYTNGSNQVAWVNGNGTVISNTIPGGGSAGTSLSGVGGGAATSTASTTWQVFGSNTSTLLIGSAGSSNNSRGCLEMGTASGTHQLEFVGIDSAGSFFVTSTRPVWCN